MLCIDFYMHKCFTCMYVYVLHVCLVPTEIRKGHWMPWDRSYRWLWAITINVPRIEPGSPGGTVTALDYWAISCSPFYTVLHTSPWISAMTLRVSLLPIRDLWKPSQTHPEASLLDYCYSPWFHNADWPSATLNIFRRALPLQLKSPTSYYCHTADKIQPMSF